MVFPVVMYGCESWTIKKPDHWRTDDFELWYWRRLLRVPWTARRSNQPILKEISPEYSLEGLMLKLKLQYFGHLMRRTDSLENTLMLGILKAGEGDDRGWDGWMASPIQWTWTRANSGRWWGTGRLGVLPSTGSWRRVGHDWNDLAAAAACPLSWWCHPTISSSVTPFSSCLQSFPASGSIPRVGYSHQETKILELRLQHKSF